MHAGIATVVGAIGARVFIGGICDTVGPRMATAGVLLLIAPPVFCASLIVDRGGIIAVRFFIGEAGTHTHTHTHMHTLLEHSKFEFRTSMLPVMLPVLLLCCSHHGNFMGTCQCQWKAGHTRGI